MASDQWLAAIGQGLDAFTQQQQQFRALDQAAGEFDRLGTQRGQGIAKMMRDDPYAYMLYAQEFGGTSSLYDAVKAEVTTAAMGGYGQAVAAAGAPDQPVTQEVVADLIAKGTKAGVSPDATLKAIEHSRIAQTRALPASAGLFKVLGIQPEDWSPVSLQRFLDHWNQTGEINMRMLEPVDDDTLPTPPSGFTWVAAGDVSAIPEGQGATVEHAGTHYRLEPILGAANAMMSTEKARVLFKISRQWEVYGPMLDRNDPQYNTPQGAQLREQLKVLFPNLSLMDLMRAGRVRSPGQ